MKVNGQSDRLIQPKQTEKYVVTVSVGQRRGKFSKNVIATTNDRENPTVTLECVANVLSAMKVEPESINFGTVKRDADVLKSTVTITRGDAGPLKPKVVTTGMDQIQAELREIEPGEKYDLEVSIKPPWPNGMLRSSVQFETGVDQAPMESIPLFATIPPRLQVSPQRFTLRPDVPSDLKLVARLNWDDNKPGKVLDVSVNDPQLTARMEEKADLQEIILEVPAGYKPTNQGTQVTLKTDDPAAATLQIPVYVIGTQPQGAQPLPAGATAVNAAQQSAMMRGPPPARAPGTMAKPSAAQPQPTTAPAAAQSLAPVVPAERAAAPTPAPTPAPSPTPAPAPTPAPGGSK